MSLKAHLFFRTQEESLSSRRHCGTLARNLLFGICWFHYYLLAWKDSVSFTICKMGIAVSSHWLQILWNLTVSWLAWDLNPGKGTVSGSYCCYLQDPGHSVEGKGAFVFLIVLAHCHCSLSINTNHHRKWVDALCKGHEGSATGQMSDALMCCWVIVSFWESPKDSNLPPVECWWFLRLRIQEGESERKLKCGWTPWEKPPKECRGLAGSPSLNGPLWRCPGS